MCLGDSITVCNNLPAESRWTRLLEQRLGAGAKVMSLGAGGTTMLSGTDRPYLESDAWRARTAFDADVAIVMLGTNDTVGGRRQCWDQVDHLEDDVRALLAAVGESFEHPRVLLCSPPPMFPDKDGLSIERSADLAERVPRLAQLSTTYRAIAAQTEGVDFVDLARVLDAGKVTDGVHLGPFGSAAIADHLAALLRVTVEPGPMGTLSLEQGLRDLGVELLAGDFHGFPRLDFALPGEGAACVLVRPHMVAAGRPWLWRARFFGHQPAFDLALLERGFHLAYVDVANLFGAPSAVQRWELAYDLLHGALGLAPKPVLLGLSRGGMPVLNFARAHPERVAAIILDNGVCDLRSWPGGRSGKRSDEAWSRMLVAHGLSEDQAWEEGRSPLDDLAPLVGIPTHVLIGGADEVVPPAENGELLIARLQELGGSVTPWRKPGLGHHPHGLDPVGPLVRTLLRQLGLDPRNPAAHPASSVEYRSGAGWGGDSWWDQVRAMRNLALEQPQLDLVFFGDSITQGLTGAGDRLTHVQGLRAIDRFPEAISLGLSGDRTEHLMFRAEHGALSVLDPDWIVVQIGINNINAARHTGAETAGGLEALVVRLLKREPQASLLLCGPFPCGAEPSDPRRAAIDIVHRAARGLAQHERVRYLDLRPLFLDEDGQANELLGGDKLHITGAGQSAWMQAIAESLFR
ncbi:MAG: lysophospholipase L1-like esterase/pimeloyl-ACP methyl ester carboxylesterase [Planctomycetota bacterium]